MGDGIGDYNNKAESWTTMWFYHKLYNKKDFVAYLKKRDAELEVQDNSITLYKSGKKTKNELDRKDDGLQSC